MGRVDPRRFSVQAFRKSGSLERLIVMSWSSPAAYKPISKEARSQSASHISPSTWAV